MKNVYYILQYLCFDVWRVLVPNIIFHGIVVYIFPIMNLYSAWRWLYIAKTCSWLSPTDKVVFRLVHFFQSQVSDILQCIHKIDSLIHVTSEACIFQNNHHITNLWANVNLNSIQKMLDVKYNEKIFPGLVTLRTCYWSVVLPISQNLASFLQTNWKCKFQKCLNYNFSAYAHTLFIVSFEKIVLMLWKGRVGWSSLWHTWHRPKN